MPAWYESRFTGLFTTFGRVPLRPHDPDVPMTAGELPAWFPGEGDLGGGGAGLTSEEADLACVGEAVERMLARALPCDGSIEAAFAAWSLDEAAVDPRRWVLFHADQYALPGFPFVPFSAETVSRWVCCRDAADGSPVWVPEEMVFLLARRGVCQRYTPGFSTGLSCGPLSRAVLLRGAQEIIERDALMGGWWGRYPVEEWPAEAILAQLGDELRERVERPNLRYRFYRFRSPYSEHVTLVSQTGLDEEGMVFSVGSACRETRTASWCKALLEALQGRHCVRRLLEIARNTGRVPPTVPTTFFEHALTYTLTPERLRETILEKANSPLAEVVSEVPESLAILRTRLGPNHSILFRNITPPGLPAPCATWVVLRVLIPGLQPLHGDHRLPFLGGPLWQPRQVVEWQNIPPHPFA
jgi:ribosomal protein S12 methylthiotransferase accessory factor